MADKRLQDKVAVVTGAAGGIGRETALRLAAEGAKVFCVDIDDKGALATVDEITAAGGTADAQGADVSSAEDVEQAVTQAVTRFGGLDVMVNIAGVEHFAPVTEMLEADFERVLRINLKGSWLGTKYAAAVMAERGGGSIINMSSLAGMVGFPGLTAYCASKAGVIMLTKTAAVELRPAGIRVNVVCPALHRHPDAATRDERLRPAARSRRRVPAHDRTDAGPDGTAVRRRRNHRLPGLRRRRPDHRDHLRHRRWHQRLPVLDLEPRRGEP